MDTKYSILHVRNEKFYTVLYYGTYIGAVQQVLKLADGVPSNKITEYESIVLTRQDDTQIVFALEYVSPYGWDATYYTSKCRKEHGH